MKGNLKVMTEMLNELRPGLSKQDETELLQVCMLVCLYDATEADTLIFFTLTHNPLSVLLMLPVRRCCTAGTSGIMLSSNNSGNVKNQRKIRCL